MDATCAIQASIHVFSLVHKYVSRILGTYHTRADSFLVAQIGSKPYNPIFDSHKNQIPL